MIAYLLISVLTPYATDLRSADILWMILYQVTGATSVSGFSEATKRGSSCRLSLFDGNSGRREQKGNRYVEFMQTWPVLGGVECSSEEEYISINLHEV